MKIKKYAAYLLIIIAAFGFSLYASQVDASAYSDCVARQQRFGEGGDSSLCNGLQGGPDSFSTTTTRTNPGGATGSGNAGSLAACDAVPDGIENILCVVSKILNSIVPLLLALGLIYFIWGVVQYMIGGDGEDKKKGRDHIIYGIIGLAVIVGVWGLVYTIVDTFDLDGYDASIDKLIVGRDGVDVCGSLRNDPKIQDLMCYATGIIKNAVIPLIFALAMVMFLWGVVQFVINSDDESKKTKGKNFMLWGIIALAVMVSVWGLVAVLGDTFNVNTKFIPQVKP